MSIITQKWSGDLRTNFPKIATYFDILHVQNCMLPPHRLSVGHNTKLHANVKQTEVAKPVSHVLSVWELSIKSCTPTWWRHQMETFPALLTIYAGNSPVTGEFQAKRSVTRSFDVFFDLRPIELTMVRLVIWDAITPIMTSLKWFIIYGRARYVMADRNTTTIETVFIITKHQHAFPPE